MRLNLAEAALHIGVPSGQLASWVWAGGGPKTANNARFTSRLEFDTEELNRWLVENRPVMDRTI